jgi:hypothetical protein
MVELSRHDRRQVVDTPGGEQTATAGRAKVQSPSERPADWLAPCQQRILGVLLAVATMLLALCVLFEPRVDLNSAAASNDVPAAYLPRIAVNDCDWSELCLVPGISTTLAQRIVADRRAHGPFVGPSDLQRVAGIGPAKQRQLSAWLDFSCHVDARRRLVPAKSNEAPARLTK